MANSEVSDRRKSPEDIVRAIMVALGSEPKTIDRIATEIGSSWATVWKYLEMINWIQRCPKTIREKPGKRIETWKREWGKIPS